MNATDSQAHDDADDGTSGSGAGAADLRLRMPLAAAFCRGRLGLAADVDDATAVAAGRTAGLRLHRYKRTQALPRVERVIATLRGIGAVDIIDIGSGRGAFLSPLLEALPHLPVCCVAVRADRVDDINAFAAGSAFAVVTASGRAP